MDDDRATVDRAVHAAQALIAQTNPALKLTLSERLSAPGLRNVVVRCQVLGASDQGRSVIVKQLALSTDGDRLDPFDPGQRWINDATGLSFLSDIATSPRVCPRVVALDSSQRLVILEDMRPAQRAVDLLHGQRERIAEDALNAVARALGQQHAASYGRKSAYDDIRRRIAGAPLTPRHPWLFAFERAVPILLRLDEMVGIQPAPALANELEAVLDAITDPGPYLAYIHGDPCPDNCLAGESVVTLIDYELGGYGHVLLDIAHARMILPSCGNPSAIPLQCVSKMENTHRHWFSQASGAATDGARYGIELTNACAAWLIYTLATTLEHALLTGDPDAPTAMRQQILGRLDAFVLVSTKHQRLPAIRDLARQTLGTLQARWPSTPNNVDRFRAFP